MTIEFFCPRWGSEALNWETFCQNVKNAGYNGFEVGIAQTTTDAELQEIWNTAEKHNLRIIVQHYDTYEANYTRHYELYCGWLEKVKALPCVKINSQTGKDFFSIEQNSSLIDAASQVSQQKGIQILHETHRNKFSFAAHITKQYLEKIPDLKLTLDISHWVCVNESFLEDQQQTVQLALDRTEHLHARVGYPCGPQVPDPRVAEWQDALNTHLNWWDKIVERKKLDECVMTITPEFGPYPYMVHLPATSKPIANQWELNIYMMELLRKRYS
ncbi:MAG: sugar phosphate isomerase/epimerase [Ginsengibacter sp.]